MVACRDERARDAEIAGDLKIVQRVTHEENLGWREAESRDEFAAERDLAVGVNVVEADDVVEVCGEPEVRDDLMERFVAIGGQN